MVVPIRMGYEFSYAKLEGAVKQALELGGTDRRDLCPPGCAHLASAGRV
jgi:hypothetical protein